MVCFVDRVCRGIATWVDTAKKKGDFCRRRIYMTTLDLRLMAVDAATGQRCPDFGDNVLDFYNYETLLKTLVNLNEFLQRLEIINILYKIDIPQTFYKYPFLSL